MKNNIKYLGIRDTSNGVVAAFEWGGDMAKCGVFSLTESELVVRIQNLDLFGRDTTIEQVALAEMHDFMRDKIGE